MPGERTLFDIGLSAQISWVRIGGVTVAIVNAIHPQIERSFKPEPGKAAGEIAGDFFDALRSAGDA